MRTIVFYIQLFIFLLYGSQDLYAGTQQDDTSFSITRSHLQKSHTVQPDSKPLPIIITDVNFDFEEDNQTNDTYKKPSDSVSSLHPALSKWYLKERAPFVPSINSSAFVPYTTFCVFYPIYITQRVLRI